MNGALTRREVLVGAAATAVALAGAAAASPANAAAESTSPDSGAAVAEADAQYGFVFRVDHCVDCGECVTACRRVHDTASDDAARRKLVQYEISQGRLVTVSTSCMHCDQPACATVCPASAITKGDGGIVSVDSCRCIGCKYCYQACPYGVPQYDAISMYKCDYCQSVGVALGDRTYCVQACHVDALLCGKIDSLREMYPDAVRIEGSTGANCYLDSGKTRPAGGEQ